jgi:hypothetical protein
LKKTAMKRPFGGVFYEDTVRLTQFQLVDECIYRATLHRILMLEDRIMSTPHYPPPAVLRVLRALGGDIREARLRRRLTMQIVAERAFTSRATLQRIENGDPGVGMGIYAAVLQALGLLERLDQLANAAHDPVGQALASAQLPKRVRMARADRQK